MACECVGEPPLSLHTPELLPCQSVGGEAWRTCQPRIRPGHFTSLHFTYTADVTQSNSLCRPHLPPALYRQQNGFGTMIDTSCLSSVRVGTVLYCCSTFLRSHHLLPIVLEALTIIGAFILLAILSDSILVFFLVLPASIVISSLRKRLLNPSTFAA